MEDYDSVWDIEYGATMGLGLRALYSHKKQSKTTHCRRKESMEMVSINGGRVLSWFSCGASSAIAAQLTIEKYGPTSIPIEVVYCDTRAYEHPDNERFMSEVAKWLEREIKIIRSDRCSTIYDVWEKTRFLHGPKGARCTIEMKKMPRERYQRADDIHIFGYTKDELHRAERFRSEQPELFVEFPLIDAGLSKQDCVDRIVAAGIRLPRMYELGYRNNNCIGCVKGGMGYWNKIRRDFPQIFHRMAALERTLGRTCLREKRNGASAPLYLDELDPNRGNYDSELDISCGPVCTSEPCQHEFIDEVIVHQGVVTRCRHCGERP